MEIQINMAVIVRVVTFQKMILNILKHYVNYIMILLASDKVEIRKEILSHYQFIISNVYNIPIANVKNLVRNVFHKEKYVLYLKK